MSETISIQGLEKIDVLRALYNACSPIGMGFLQAQEEPMTQEQADELAQSGNWYFDYVMGRPVKVDLSKDEFSPHLYDRDQGEGAAEFVVSVLRATGDVEHPALLEMHYKSLKAALEYTKGAMGTDHEVRTHGRVAEFRLGMPDIPELREAIARIEKP